MPLPTGARRAAFASAELFLELVRILRETHDWDIETILIYYAIAEATMRPEILQGRRQKRSEAEADGAISRVAISDRTGIPRETVRRKANWLMSIGAIEEARYARLRVPQQTRDAPLKQIVRRAAKTVAVYRARAGAAQ